MTLFAQTILADASLNASKELAETATKTTNAVTESFSRMLSHVIEWTPDVIAATGILIVGYIVARLVSSAVTAITEKLGLQKAAQSSGFVQSMTHVGIQRTLPQIVGTMVFWLLMCVFLIAAFDVLKLQAVTTALEGVLSYIPKLLVATFVIVLGLLLATFLKGVIATSADRVGINFANQLATACYWVLALMTFIAAFDQLHIQFRLLNEMILIVCGGLAVAFALSFGLGGRDVMAGILAGYYVRQRLQAGDQVTVCGFEGRVREVGPVATIIETDEGGLVERHSIPNSKMLNEAVR